LAVKGFSRTLLIQLIDRNPDDNVVVVKKG